MTHARRFVPVLLFVLFAAVAGCGGGKGGGGSDGGGATGAVNCRPLSSTSTDCGCSSTGTNSLSECSGDSVASTDHGYCCSGGGFCTCFRTACITLPAIGYCECSSPLDYTSMRVDNCPPATGGGTCCLDTGLYPYSCHCSDAVTSCPSGQTQVTSCSLADVMYCRAGETVVARCK